MDRFDELTLMLPCPYCQAPPEEWCVTTGGRWARWLHSARMEPIVLAWRHGWDTRTEGMVRWYVGQPKDFSQFVARWVRDNWKAKP